MFMFLLVTMEKTRIDGFHGDYLKISFFDSPDVAAGSLDALSAIKRLLCDSAKGCYERSRIQTKLPPAPENARTPSWERCTSVFSWGPTRLASAPQPISIAWKLFIIIIIVKQNKRSLYRGSFQVNTESRENNITNPCACHLALSLCQSSLISPPRFYRRVGVFVFHPRYILP